jgi:3-oxoacyl-[acyl-carrier protein] reductase
MPKMIGSSDQIVVITGTSKGLGMQLAQMFIDSGGTVFGCSRGDFGLNSNRYHHTAIDIGNEEQVRAWIRGIRKEAGRIDLLVCNAGIVESVLPMTLTPTKVLDAYLRTNVAGTFLVCREAGKVMVAQRSGRIVAISSTMTRLHEPGTSIYSASKSAIEEMIKVLARELAGANVTCNTVAPGLISTEASDAFGDKWHDRMLELQTIKRVITVTEIFHTISFFASPAAASVTGQTLYMGLAN